MKKNILILMLFSTVILLAQNNAKIVDPNPIENFCDPNGVSTNPQSPMNPNDPAYLNHFDWTTTSPYYQINTTCSPNTSTPNPFQSNQLELLPLSLSKDMMPIDGWEMIAYNLGFDNNNYPLASRPEHTYIMLYNKYTGILRILVKWCRNTNYNGAQLTLKFAPGFQTNLLDMSTEEKALDVAHVVDPSISTALKFYNDNNFWAYADFKLNYDPCTCSFTETSRLALYSELISNSSVVLTGKINGTITSISNGQGSANSDGAFWKTANSINDKMMKVHKGVTSFAQNYQSIYQNLSDGGVTINAINTIGNFLNNNNFMKAGLKALPYVSQGVKFLSGLLGGGASGTQPIQLAPLSVNLDVKISGTISTADPMHNQTIGLPGSMHQNDLPGIMGGQPLYNETLGVFALLNHPVMFYNEQTTQQIFLNREKSMFNNYYEITNKYDFVTRNYKLNGDVLRYKINPTSNLTLQDAEVLLIVEYEKPSVLYAMQYASPLVLNLNSDLANGLDILGTDRGPAVDESNAIFQNAFKPIGIMNFKNDYSFSFLNRISQVSNGGKIRELAYNSSAENFPTLPKFSCPNWSCSWTNIGMRPFTYVQSKTELSYSNPSVNASSFVTNPFYSYKNPSGIQIRSEFLTPRVKNFKLKFVLNLKRTDNPTAQNVLYVVTYPIELKPAPVGYNMSGSNYINDANTYAAQVGFTPAIPTNKVVQATQVDINSLCASTIYKNNRISLSGKLVSSDEVNNELDKKVEIDKPVLYPIPAKNELNIVLNNCKPKSIVDFYGRTINEVNIDNNEKIKVDISNYVKGIYVLIYEDSLGNIKRMKFLIQ